MLQKHSVDVVVLNYGFCYNEIRKWKEDFII